MLLDQLLWRPVVVWAQRFRVEEGGNQEEMSSWFLNWLRRSHLLAALGVLVHVWTSKRAARPRKLAAESDANATHALWPARISLISAVESISRELCFALVDQRFACGADLAKEVIE